MASPASSRRATATGARPNPSVGRDGDAGSVYVPGRPAAHHGRPLRTSSAGLSGTSPTLWTDRPPVDEATMPTPPELALCTASARSPAARLRHPRMGPVAAGRRPPTHAPPVARVGGRASRTGRAGSPRGGTQHLRCHTAATGGRGTTGDDGKCREVFSQFNGQVRTSSLVTSSGVNVPLQRGPREPGNPTSKRCDGP